MRKSLWIILTILLVGAGAPLAHADAIVNVSVTNATFTGSLQCPLCTEVFSANFEYDNTTDTILLATLTFNSVGESFSFVDEIVSPYVVDFRWRSPVGSHIVLLVPATSTGAILPGVYTEGPFNIPFNLVYDTDDPSFQTPVVTTSPITVTAVPEPNTLSLSLLGIGLMLVMRKRIAQGHPQAC